MKLILIFAFLASLVFGQGVVISKTAKNGDPIVRTATALSKAAKKLKKKQAYFREYYLNNKQKFV